MLPLASGKTCLFTRLESLDWDHTGFYLPSFTGLFKTRQHFHLADLVYRLFYKQLCDSISIGSVGIGSEVMTMSGVEVVRGLVKELGVSTAS